MCPLALVPAYGRADQALQLRHAIVGSRKVDPDLVPVASAAVGALNVAGTSASVLNVTLLINGANTSGDSTISS